MTNSEPRGHRSSWRARQLRTFSSTTNNTFNTNESPGTTATRPSLPIPSMTTSLGISSSSIHTHSFSDSDDSTYNTEGEFTEIGDDEEDDDDDDNVFAEADAEGASMLDDCTMEMSEFSEFVSKNWGLKGLEDCESLACPRNTYRTRSLEEITSANGKNKSVKFDSLQARQRQYRKRYNRWKARQSKAAFVGGTTEDEADDEETAGDDSISIDFTADSRSIAKILKSDNSADKDSASQQRSTVNTPQSLPATHTGSQRSFLTNASKHGSVSLPPVSEHPSDEYNGRNQRTTQSNNNYNEDFDGVSTCASEITFDIGDLYMPTCGRKEEIQEVGHEVEYDEQRDKRESAANGEGMSIASDDETDLSRRLSRVLRSFSEKMMLNKSDSKVTDRSKSSQNEKSLSIAPDMTRKTTSKSNSTSSTTTRSKSSQHSQGNASEPIDVTDIESLSEYALASTETSPGRLRHVQYVPHLDEASANRGELSTVEFISPRRARAAFAYDVPRDVPCEDHLRDDISSLGPPQGMSRLRPIQQWLWSSKSNNDAKKQRFPVLKQEQPNQLQLQPQKRDRSHDEENPPSRTQPSPESALPGLQHIVTVLHDDPRYNKTHVQQYPTEWHIRPASPQGQNQMQDKAIEEDRKESRFSCMSPRTDLEVFFIALIVVSVFTLVVLLALIVSQN